MMGTKSFKALLGISLLAAAATVSAQLPMDIEFTAAPMSFESETVTGAPYSAEAVTEFVQRLADGNRISRESKAQIARDSAGRTRREQGLAMLGPMVNTPEEFRHVQITDPQAGTMVMLNLRDQTAEKMPVPNVRVFAGTAGEKITAAGKGVTVFSRKVEMALPGGPPMAGQTLLYTARTSAPASPPDVQSLGKQSIEGVEAEGTRTTFTIPAGQVGNELPLSIVSERWYSPELKVLVMSRQSDPRSGETTYRLTNIVRAEPDPALFEIPAGFTVMDGGPERDVIIRKMR
jgi:hypothetical protein